MMSETFPPQTDPSRQRSRAMLEELGRYVVAEPWPFAVDLEHSHGMWLATVDGDRIMDWGGLYGSRLLGYNHPRLFEPAYLARLTLAANNKMANPDFLSQECLDYYRLLYRLAPRCLRGNRLEVYAVNSGAEAVENMLKYLINLHLQREKRKGHENPGKKFIGFEGAFHGRTVLTLQLTHLAHDPIVTRDYHGMFPELLMAPFSAWERGAGPSANRAREDACLGAVERLLEKNRGDIAALIAEPLQGAGGHRMPTEGFFPRLSVLLHDYDCFLGFDEVQTAGGNCGCLFLCDHFCLPYPPQAVAVAKKFGCGAIFMRETMEDVGVLDSTWGGNLSDMVRVTQEFRVVEEERLLESVPARAQVLVDGLLRLSERYPRFVRNVRGYGLYQGFSCATADDKALLLEKLREEEKCFLLGAGAESIRLRPPIDVTADEITLLLEAIERVCRRLTG